MHRRITFESEQKQRGAVLRVMCLSLMMVVAAVASLNVALPGIARDTGATQTQLQWIVDAYALAFAALLLPAGAIGDRFGRKPILAVRARAVRARLARGDLRAARPAQLIGLRAAMGVAAAFVMPVTLSVITTIFPPEERGKAVGTWVGVAAGGGVLGLLVSGVLLEWLSWPSIFGLNVVLATLALVGTIAIVPATRESRPPRLDPVGTLISVVGARGARLRDHRGPRARLGRPVTVAPRWSPASPGSSPSSLWELRRREPMLDPRNFLRRGFGAGSLSMTVQFFAAFGFLFLALPYLQLVMGFSPLQASAALLPMALVVIPLSRVAPAIAARVGVRVTGATGLEPDGDRLPRPLAARRRLVLLGTSSPGCSRSAPAWRSPARRRRPRSSPRSRARSRASRRPSTTSRASSAARSGSPCSAA